MKKYSRIVEDLDNIEKQLFYERIVTTNKITKELK